MCTPFISRLLRLDEFIAATGARPNADELREAVNNIPGNVDYSTPFALTDEAVLQQERDVRTKMDAAGHTLVFEYKVHSVLCMEHKRLCGEVRERGLTLLENSPTTLK